MNSELEEILVTRSAAITFSPCASSLLSLIGSSCIVLKLIRNRPSLRRFNNRILLCMSLMDIIKSVSCGLSTFPAPKDSPTPYAYGNVVTCDIQGFMLLLSYSIVFYNCLLTLNYYLQTTRNFSEKKTRQRVEPLAHLFAFGWPFVTSIIGLKMELYNFTGNKCRIGSYPFDCIKNENIECTRGKNAFIWRHIFVGVWAPIWMIWLTVSSVWISCRIRRLEVRNVRRDIETGTISSHLRILFASETKILGEQCILYSTVVYFTFAWPFFLRTIQRITNCRPFWLIMVSQIFFPLQGFLNLLVYARPEVMNIRRENPQMSWYDVITEFFHST